MQFALLLIRRGAPGKITPRGEKLVSHNSSGLPAAARGTYL